MLPETWPTTFDPGPPSRGGQWVRFLLLFFASVLVGIVAWSGQVFALPVALLFPLLWALARTRLQVALVSAGYFLAASRGLPVGVASFYGSDLWPGLLLWFVASAGFVLVHMIFWTPGTGWHRPARFILASLIMAVPPFGITGWAHPFTAAGILFPGWHWFGLLALMAALAGMTTRHWPVVAVVVACFWIWSASHSQEPQSPENWLGIDLEMGAELGRDLGLDRQQALIRRVRDRAKDEGGEVNILLPESALGFWTPGLGNLWQRELAGSGVTVLAGAAEVLTDGYDNVLVAISEESQDVLYRQRMPVPGSMWQPWRHISGRGGGARAEFYRNPVVSIGEKRVAVLICYEQLIIWPVLQSLVYDVDLVIAVGNGWWTRGTSIIDIQRSNVRAWGMLFDTPVVSSFNR